jgi:predicted phosphodiesterase
MKKDIIRYIVLSDIHLGNKRNTSKEIIRNLIDFFTLKDVKNLDVVFLAGDIFDTLLTIPSEDNTEILLWVDFILSYCSKNKIKLRVLEGTPSHDWKQSKVFETVKNINRSTLDFKYIDTLLIENMEDLGINILYVPDEWNSSTDKTFSQVQELMRIQKLDQVDIAIMHGQFGYQLPVHLTKIPKHNEANYLNIVKHFISIGHVHNFSFYERIIAQGSFDRLSHNEEQPKGAVICEIRNDNTRDFFFIENTGAKIFKTFEFKSGTFETSLAKLVKQTDKLPIGSYVRIKGKKDHPLIMAFEDLKKILINFNLTKLVVDEEEDTNLYADEISDITYAPIAINKDNILSIILESVRKTVPDISDIRLDILADEINEVR